MIGKIVAAALALLLAGGDLAWAGRLQSAPLLGRAAPAIALPALQTQAVPLPLRTIPAQAALAELQQAALPLSGQAAQSAGSEQAEQSRRWDAASPQPASEPPGAPVSGLFDSDVNRLSAPARSTPAARHIPPPKAFLSRAGVLAGWAGTTGLAALAHAPFENLPALYLSLGLGLGLGVMILCFTARFSEEPGGKPASTRSARPVSKEESERVKRQLARLAAESGLPAPKRLVMLETDRINAHAGGGTAVDYEIGVFGGVLDLPLHQQEAVLRHEIGHVRHSDTLWRALSLVFSGIPPTVAMISGAMDESRAWIALPFVVVSILAPSAIRKLHELEADQFAASTQGTAQPLISGLRAMERQDAEERAAPPKTKLEAWTRRAEDAWGKVSWLWASHPSLAYRIRRLERLEK